ncbi:MAG: hypothetical protein M3373_11415 [Gemmatimonadota bacterium]|nr:hypothetical protein [Gemmatimonadota bacterium]
MPSATDIFNEIKGANQRLDNILAVEQEVRDAVLQVDQGVDQLVSLQSFANGALVHQIKQNDTIICLLRQIADNTCGILNEAHIQTGLQTEIADDTDTLAALYSISNADAAQVRVREEALKQQIEACCPPEPSRPVCQPKECPDPGRFDVPVILGPTPPSRPGAKKWP